MTEADLHVTRAEFEEIARPHLDRSVTLTLATLRAARLPREEVAGVFLVGGSSRVPLAATLLHRALGIEPAVTDLPELVVAQGSLHARTTAAPASVQRTTAPNANFVTPANTATPQAADNPARPAPITVLETPGWTSN
jgi:cell division ATPase FtsA